jgi:hypothetical protein
MRLFLCNLGHQVRKADFWVWILATVPWFCWASLPESCSISGAESNYSTNLIINAIPARIQWNSTEGYCGETALVSAGLYYGQYISQYDARALANTYEPQDPSKKLQLTQILIGDPYFSTSPDENNVVNALKRMHLNYDEFKNLKEMQQSSTHFIIWLKKHIIQHHPVAIGVYENTSLIPLDDPQDTYDHIVPVFGIKSQHPLNEIPTKYYTDDLIYFHDNSLYDREQSILDCYVYPAAALQKNRKSANKKDSPLYSLSDNSNQEGNYGIAITGIQVSGGMLLPVSIQTDPVEEEPEIQDKSDKRPKPSFISLTIQVSGLKVHTNYILYKYNSFAQLPVNDDYSKSYGKPEKKCSIWINSGSQFITKEQILSSSTAIYRAIAAKDDDAIQACVSE